MSMDVQTNAMIAELETQRNLAFTRCGQLAAQLAKAQAQLAEAAKAAKAQVDVIEAQKKELAELRPVEPAEAA